MVPQLHPQTSSSLSCFMKQKYSTLTSSASQMYRSAAFLCVLKVRHVFWHAVSPQCVLGCNLMRKRDRSLRFLWERSSHCRCRWKAGRCFPPRRRMLKCYLKPVAAWSCNCCFFFFMLKPPRGGGGLKRLIWSVQEGITRCESVLPRLPSLRFLPRSVM